MKGDVDLKAYEAIVREFDPLEPDDIFIVLASVQEAYGYIPRAVLEDMSLRFRRPAAELYGAVTFYPGFRLGPAAEEDL